MSENFKIDLSKAPKDYAAFGRAVWASLTNSKTVALSEGFPAQMAALAVKNGLKASERAVIARSMRVKADQAVALSQGATDEQARAWATREHLGVDGFGSQKQFNVWADQVGF